MTLLMLFLLLVLYLFIGSLVMLAVNDIFYGAVDRSDFVAGMLAWPGVGAVLIAALMGSTLVSVHSWLQRRVSSRQ